jgi:hypothetical protein
MVWLSADYTASTASILNLFTLSLDRYWSITSPLKYLGKRTKSRALLMITLAWSISLLWVLPITGWSYAFNNGVRYVPADKCNTEYDKNIAFKIATAICNFYLPLLAMIMINAKIYMVIRRRYHNPIMKYSSMSSNANSGANNPNAIPATMNADPGVVSAAGTTGIRNSLFVKQQNTNIMSSSASQNSSAEYNNNTTEHTFDMYYQIKDHGQINSRHKSQNNAIKKQRNRSLSLDMTKLNNSTHASQLLDPQHTRSSSHRRSFKCLTELFACFGCKSLGLQRDGSHRSAASHARSTRNITHDVRMSKLVGGNEHPTTNQNAKFPSMVFSQEFEAMVADQRTSPLLLSKQRKDSIECYHGGSMRQQPTSQRSSVGAITDLKGQCVVSKRLHRSDMGHLSYAECGRAADKNNANTKRNDSTCSKASNNNNNTNAVSANTNAKKSARKNLELKSINSSGSDTKINHKGFMNKQEKAFKVKFCKLSSNAVSFIQVIVLVSFSVFPHFCSRSSKEYN